MYLYKFHKPERVCIVCQLNAAVSASGGEDRLRLRPGEEAAPVNTKKLVSVSSRAGSMRTDLGWLSPVLEYGTILR